MCILYEYEAYRGAIIEEHASITMEFGEYLCSDASNMVATRTRGILGGFPIILNSILLTFLSFSNEALDWAEMQQLASMAIS